MTVVWSRHAIADRTGLLHNAFARAVSVPDPHLFAAALACDTAIEREGNALDGAARYRTGVIAGIFLYVTRDGRHLLAYQREGEAVQIDRVLPTRRQSGDT